MKVIPILILTMLLQSPLLAQTQVELPSAPVVWERYKIDKHQISVLFPKLPTVIASGGGCSEVEKRSHFAYSEGAVYEVTVISRTKDTISSFCPRVERFNSNLLSDRLGKLRSDLTEDPSMNQLTDGRRVYKFSDPTLSVYVYDDVANKRWAEVSVKHRSDAKPNVEFLDSLLFANKEGKSIGDGAPVTLGDPNFQTNTITENDRDKTSVDAIVIVAKPRASYTDAARQAKESGTVRLKVSLLANGSVGTITPVTSLRYGLTEQAIAAASKIVFLPKRVGGVPVSAVLSFEYSFSVY